jgi:hypothetical protein
MNSPLHHEKIPTMDMKVLVYSNFCQKEFWKKMKSPSSMRDGSFHPSKCKGKVQKWECCTPNARFIPKHPHNTKKINLKNLKNLEKREVVAW